MSTIHAGLEKKELEKSIPDLHVHSIPKSETVQETGNVGVAKVELQVFSTLCLLATVLEDAEQLEGATGALRAIVCKLGELHSQKVQFCRITVIALEGSWSW